jgi:hypothetical protein
MYTLSNISRLVLIILCCQCAALADTYFVKVKLVSGISLDLPRNWWLIQGELNKTIETSGQAVLDLSGIDLGGRTNINLIAANCQPKSMYASVRLDLCRPPFIPAEEAWKFGTNDLEEMGADVKKELMQTLPKQGVALKDYISTTKEEIAGFPALVCHYRRTENAEGKDTVMVWIIQICAPDRTYRLNLAYRESEAGIWKPVLERIKTSIVIPKKMPDEK